MLPLARLAAVCAAGMLLATSAQAMAHTEGCAVESYGPEDLMQWPAWGAGQRMSVSRQMLMEEAENSQGYMVISPESYEGDFVLRFEAIVMTTATVIVLGLIGDSDPAGLVEFPDGYDANAGYVINNYPFMMVAFHNATHNRPGPFIATFENGQRRILDEGESSVIKVDTVHRVEFGKTGETVWLDIDGQRVVTGPIQPGMDRARLMMRIRGTGFREAAAIFRNVELEHCLPEEEAQQQ